MIILYRDVRVREGTLLDIVERGFGNIIMGEENKYFHYTYMNKVNSFNGVKSQMTWDINFK